MLLPTNQCLFNPTSLWFLPSWLKLYPQTQLYFFFLIEVQLIYNVTSYRKVIQLYLYIQTYSFPDSFPLILSIVPYAIQ